MIIDMTPLLKAICTKLRKQIQKYPFLLYVIVGILCLTLPSPFCLDVTRNVSLSHIGFN